LIYHHQKPKKRKKKSKQISLNSSFYVKIECFLNFFLSVAMSHLIYPSPKKRKKKKKKPIQTFGGSPKRSFYSKIE
jgi:hypothetical protein